MSRSGYSEALDNWDLIRWRGQVASATRGRRGQKFFADLLKALEELPEKSLIAEDLETPEGEVCALGALGKARGINLQELDPEDYDGVAATFGIAHQLAQEVAYENDCWYKETPEARYQRMKTWVSKQIKKPVTYHPVEDLNGSNISV